MSGLGGVEYIRQQIRNHVRLFFEPDALPVLTPERVRFLSRAEALRLREPVIAVPCDIPASLTPDDRYCVPFNGTHLTLWNRLPAPAEPGWQALPNPETPLWYRHQSGTHIPAWNLYGNLYALLTFAEERAAARDSHGRFVGTFSPRHPRGLLRVPAFNEAVAALVAACIGIQERGEANATAPGLIKPAAIVLSHDCDILSGNDLWTQSVRLLRVPLPLRHGRPPRLANIWWAIRNAARPHDFYFDNIPGMVDLERQFRCHSTFYLLNGSGGRYGARSGSRLLPEVIRAVPHGWDIGMHYNFDTHLDPDRFARQRDELTRLLGQAPIVGRAHYLRFDPERSPAFLKGQGILCDESAGYSDLIGYRCGIGGCFELCDPAGTRGLGVWEVPMVVMDGTLPRQFGDGAVAVFEQMIRHLTAVGGAVGMVFHPGVFHNPEVSGMPGLYLRVLTLCRDYRVRSETALSLARSVSGT